MGGSLNIGDDAILKPRNSSLGQWKLSKLLYLFGKLRFGQLINVVMPNA